MLFFARVGSSKEGFTLVELLIVMAIMAVLASFAFSSYLKYREKSLITSHALPMADACSKDIIAYCINLAPDSPITVDLSTVELVNCRDQNIMGYDLNITLAGSFTCNPGGTVSNGTVEAILEDVPSYKAVCNLNENSIVCKVEER